MNKKALFVTIQIFILIVAIFSPKILAENQIFELEGSDSFRIFKFNTTTELILDKIPDSSKPMTINISYPVDVILSFKFELPNFFPKILLGTKIGNWIIFRDKNHNMTVDIEVNIVKKPKWCDAELENTTITIDDITTEAKTIKTKLNLKINSTAPALEKETIKLSAKFTPDSNWGLKPSEYQKNFTIIPEYKGELEAEFSVPRNTTEVITKPNQYTLIPVNITNIGNGESFFTLEIKEQTGWNITLEPNNITIPTGETKKINVNVTPPQAEEEKTMDLNLTIKSKSTSNLEIDAKYLQGEILELPGFKLIKKDTTQKIDFTIIILGVIVIILSLVIILFFFKKKK